MDRMPYWEYSLQLAEGNIQPTTTVSKDAPHILAINPWIHDFAAYDVWAKPLGLLLLASILRDHGCRVSYIDCLDRFHPGAGRQDPGRRNGRGPYLKKEIPKPGGLGDVPRRFSRYGLDPVLIEEGLAELPEPDLVLVTSSMTYWWPGIRETIDTVRRVFPRSPVVLGGIYATLCRSHAEKHSGADTLVPGPGEGEILDLVERTTRWRVRPRFDPDDLDTLPYPAFDMQGEIPYVPLLTSRGCPFSCTYCASHILQPKRLRRSPGGVVGEIRYWHDTYGVREFAFYDDALLVDANSHAIPILEGIIAAGMKVRFHTPNALHIREISNRSARLMFRAGFTTLRLGLETADPRHRDAMDGKVTLREFEQAVDHLKSAGFTGRQIGVYLLAGLPGQPTGSVLRSIDRVKEAGATPIPAYYTPIPHTGLWNAAAASSRYDLTADPLYTNNTIFPCRKEPFSWEEITRIKRRTEA